MHAVYLVALTLLACRPPMTSFDDVPWIRLVVPGELRPEYLPGARAWESLGFDVELHDAKTAHIECGRYWYKNDQNTCQISIGIVIEPDLIERTGSDAAAQRDFRKVALDDSLVVPEQIKIAVAHEVGHIVLDTPEHTKGGVMGGVSSVLTDADFALACRTISVCR